MLNNLYVENIEHIITQIDYCNWTNCTKYDSYLKIDKTKQETKT